MAYLKSAFSTKMQVWRITPQAPLRKFVNTTQRSAEQQEALDRPASGWGMSSLELSCGLEVSEVSDSMPASLIDELFSRPSK